MPSAVVKHSCTWHAFDGSLKVSSRRNSEALSVVIKNQSKKKDPSSCHDTCSFLVMECFIPYQVSAMLKLRFFSLLSQNLSTKKLKSINFGNQNHLMLLGSNRKRWIFDALIRFARISDEKELFDRKILLSLFPRKFSIEKHWTTGVNSFDHRQLDGPPFASKNEQLSRAPHLYSVNNSDNVSANSRNNLLKPVLLETFLFAHIFCDNNYHFLSSFCELLIPSFCLL